MCVWVWARRFKTLHYYRSSWRLRLYSTSLFFLSDILFIHSSRRKRGINRCVGVRYWKRYSKLRSDRRTTLDERCNSSFPLHTWNSFHLDSGARGLNVLRLPRGIVELIPEERKPASWKPQLVSLWHVHWCCSCILTCGLSWLQWPGFV